MVLGSKNSTNNSWRLINIVEFGVVSKVLDFLRKPLGFWGFDSISIRVFGIGFDCVRCLF
jgi:hypothetical protein